MKKNLLITLLSRTEGVLPLGRIQVSLKEKFCTDSIQVEVMQLSTCRKYLNWEIFKNTILIKSYQKILLHLVEWLWKSNSPANSLSKVSKYCNKNCFKMEM